MAKQGSIIRPLNISKKNPFSKYDTLRIPKFNTYPLDNKKYAVAKSGALRRIEKGNSENTNIADRI